MIEGNDADGHSKGGAVAAVPFSRTIRPLVISPAAALAVLGGYLILLKEVGPEFLMVLLICTPFVYAVEVLFVVPILWLWPASRRPSFAFGAIWGAAAAWGFWLLFTTAAWYEPGGVAFPPQYHAVPATWPEWRGLALLMIPGIASGVLFAYLSLKADAVDDAKRNGSLMPR
jgi:hypothetical protein